MNLLTVGEEEAQSMGVNTRRLRGAVIVCAGADDANVRLGLTEAAKAFTGFGSDDITILKLTDMSIGEAKK